MHKIRNNPNIRAIKLWDSLNKAYFPVMIAQIFFNCLSPYFNIYMSAEIVNELMGTINKDKIILLITITIFGNLTISIINGLLNRSLEHNETIMNQKESMYFNNKVLTLDYEKLEDASIRQLRRKINESAKINWHGKQSLLNNVYSLLYFIINLMMALYLFTEMLFVIMRFKFDILVLFYVVIILILIILNIWISFFSEKKISAISNDVSKIMIDENRIDDALDCYNMGKDVRLYRQDKIIKKVDKLSFDLHKKAFRMLGSVNFKHEIPKSLLSHMLLATTYLFVTIYSLKGAFRIGSIIKYIGFMRKMISSIISLFTVMGDIKYNTPFIEDYLAFLDIPSELYKGTLPVEKRNDNEYEIEFKNVSFKYPSSDIYALRNVSLKLKIGEKLAVVGMNGSGKTTFIKLLCRLYDPTEGEITLNGINIKKYNYTEYMSIFSVVFQDFKLLSFSLGQNVSATIDYDQERVEKCLNEAGIHLQSIITKDDAKMKDNSMKLQFTLDSFLYRDFDEKGVEISGGEAQKIALARALYKDAPFIILDEPTAALDPISEYEIYSKFNEIVGDKTAIYISHRLSSCRFCDDIVVFHEGELIQRGNHNELVIDKDGKYHELWSAQAQYYVNSN